MNGKLFFEVVCKIVGVNNATLYAQKFGDLDDWLNNDLRNYEGLAFYIYTTEMGWYEVINSELWSHSPSSHFQLFKSVLNNALKKMEPYKANKGIVFRGFRAKDLESFLHTYRLGEVITFHGFTSASFKQDYAYVGNVLFIIKALTGCGVWFLSPKYEECEVLIPAGKSFRVEGVERQGAKVVVYLEEIPS
ncbi:NAD:arginine ADP-ribosyltransferase [Labrenzia sp. THAF82]|uniref:ADP-ribosyltransferase domain-containing protein n=1 Tax=Labrenzia sp. THAF82 TaxID=2587861 RepID=UPI0012689946|nr:ADP-ribosyltransferase domain-containing protein [Labrenzia sp. THAF82]QFT29098.1 NAD:arginine ADP-ribosyltransferase [Labrenzia sp. THAF82]